MHSIGLSRNFFFMVSGTKFTKISDLSPNMTVPLLNVIVQVDMSTLRLRVDGSGEAELGDASGSILMSIPKKCMEKFADPGLAFVIKNILCVVIGNSLMLQVSSRFSEISKVDKLPLPFFHRNKGRNFSHIEYALE